MRRFKLANARKTAARAPSCPFEFDHRSQLAAFLETAAQASPEARQMLVDVLHEMGAEKVGQAYRVELHIDPRLRQVAATLRKQAALESLATRVDAQVADRIATRAPSARELLQGECVGLQDVAFLGAAYLASPSARAAIVGAFCEIGAGEVGAAYRIEFRLDERLEQLAARLREFPQFERLERHVASFIARNN
jgi:hypothetical protein